MHTYLQSTDADIHTFPLGETFSSQGRVTIFSVGENLQWCTREAPCSLLQPVEAEQDYG